MSPEQKPPGPYLRREPGRTWFPFLLVAFLGLGYEAVLMFTPLLSSYRFPVPYAVPIFDTPFALVAMGVGYLCLERHRLRQDVQSASLGTTLWLTALLALAHIVAQPDYPGTPGVPAGVAPYFFFLSYLAGFAGLGLATHAGDRRLPLSDRARFSIGTGVFCLSVLVVVGVIQIRPLLPSLVMKPGRLTLFAIWAAGVSNGLLGAWALWRGWKKRQDVRDSFAGFLALAGLIWLLGLAGFLIYPFRYAVSWYVAGLARPIGVVVIFVGLLREEVWLYREARARLRDLEGLHTAGHALVTNLDPERIVNTIASKALDVSGAEGAILFRLEAQAQVLRPVSCAGAVTPGFVSSLELPVGRGVAGLAVADRQPVWTSNLQVDDRISLPSEGRERVRREGLKAVLAIPIQRQSGEVFGALSVSYGKEREFADTDIQLLSAFGTQVAVAMENAISFEQLTVKARHDAALREFSQRLLEASGEETILGEAVRVARDLLRADYGGLFLLDPKAGDLSLQAGCGWEPGVVGAVTLPPSAASFAGHALIQKESVQVEDLSREHRFSTPPYLAEHGVQSGIAVPLGVREQPVAVLAAYYRTPHRFSDEENRVLLSLAHQTALALEKVRLYAELQANIQRLQETQAQLIQADKLTALGTLLSGMAHELNNPLATILMSVQLLKAQRLVPDPIRKRIDLVEQECERASRIVRDLLVFARRKPHERRQVDLNAVVEAALALQAPEFDLNNIRVVRDFDPTLPQIWADPYQLQQVFLNLFSNATFAMKSAHGRGTLWVRASRCGSQVCAEVEDDGPGIPPEQLNRIFDPFFTTKAAEGTGLGLSLSLAIVEAQGGRIAVENVPGSGARFTVRLAMRSGVDVVETSPAALPTAGRQARILVVDDEHKLREILTEVLGALGHQVEEAATGGEAIEGLQRQVYDLITLDLRLPDISGRDVWTWLLARNPAQASRVVFMTGDIVSSETQEFIEKTGRPLLTKPVTIERIRRIVDEVLREEPAGVS